MTKIKSNVTGTRVTIDFGQIASESEALVGRVDDVLPILEALVLADVAWQGLTDEEREQRGRASTAMEMKSQAALFAARAQAELQIEIIKGSQSIADIGFPELLDPYGDYD